jgi:hypothetical protein
MGDPCDYSAECDDGLHCATLTGEATGDYQCLPLGTAGTKCFFDSGCEVGLFCVESLGGRRGGTLGGTFSECLYHSDCEAGLVCAGGECAEAIGPGLSCEFSDVCDGGYGCGFVTGTCIALGGPGDPCTTSLECQGRCDTTLGECVDICGGTLF